MFIRAVSAINVTVRGRIVRNRPKGVGNMRGDCIIAESVQKKAVRAFGHGRQYEGF